MFSAIINLFFSLKFNSKQIKEAWDAKKSICNNLHDMGLSADPNSTFRIPGAKVRIVFKPVNMVEGKLSLCTKEKKLVAFTRAFSIYLCTFFSR